MNILLNISKWLSRLRGKSEVDKLSLLVKESQGELKQLKITMKDIKAVEEYILDSRKLKVLILFYGTIFCIIKYVTILISTTFY